MQPKKVSAQKFQASSTSVDLSITHFRKSFRKIIVGQYSIPTTVVPGKVPKRPEPKKHRETPWKSPKYPQTRPYLLRQPSLYLKFQWFQKFYFLPNQLQEIT